MGELKSLEFQATILIEDPPQAHARIRDYLDTIELVDFQEFQVIENDGECRLVNFYAEQESLAIELTYKTEDEVFGEVNIIRINMNVHLITSM